SGGRLALHVTSGGDDTDQRRDGDWVGHDDRYRRTDEYLDILRRIWTADGPIDHDGEFYRFRGAFSEVRPVRKPYLPIYFGGASLRRGLGGGRRGRRQARRRLHALGRAAGRHPPANREGAGGGCPPRALAPLQRLSPPDP